MKATIETFKLTGYPPHGQVPSAGGREPLDENAMPLTFTILRH